jgi:tetratricopeptide (TPR) repeat protein
MRDLRILFTAADRGYRAHLADAGGARLGVEVPFAPFLTETDYDDLRWYLEEYLELPDGGAIKRAERVEATLGRWGRKLHDDLFAAPENRHLLKQLLASPEPRELTLATRDPELLRLPWELMEDDAGSLAQRLSVRRQLEEPEATMPRPAQLPLRILYIVSRPADTGFIDPRFTAKALLDALDPLGASVRVDFCRPPTVGRMEEMLREGQQSGDPYDLVHFDGHGTFLPKEQIGVLCFEKPDNGSGRSKTHFVRADRLGDLLTSYNISLVVLEACRSATLGRIAVFRSIAPRLIQAGVGSVLSMSHAVHVEAARLLLDEFYRGLVRGASIGQAVAEARNALRLTPGRWIGFGPTPRTVELRDWFLPHLYQRDADDVLVPEEAVRLIRDTEAEDTQRLGFRSPATQGDESGPFPPPPQFGFQGRAQELYELERLFRIRRGVVLHAMGGMGKTALATEAAHWWTRSGLFRDGACFLSFEPFASADRAIQVLGSYLAGPRFDQLPAVEQRRRAIELFQQNEVLMVWDNFESTLPQFNEDAVAQAAPYDDDERRRLAELFRDLTTGPGKGCLLVTCRPGETGLPGALRYELQGLARADSLWLLSRILKRDGLDLSDPRLSRDKLEPLLRDLADHPLSLELVGPHLRNLTPEEIRADFGRLLLHFQQEAPEGRNQSLLASLEFSRRHLSQAAREALLWLGLFSGGVLEALLLGVSQISSEAWEPIRRELQGIALLRVEDDLQLAGCLFLRFHPTLASAAADPTLAENPEIRDRFIGVYLALMLVLDEALKGSQSRAALEVLTREEANYRTAVRWAVEDQKLPAAAALGNPFSIYLQMSGRLRELDAWVQWLKDAVGQQGFTAEAADYERQRAWALVTQGDPQGAVDQLQDLIERLRQTTEFDPSFQLAVATGILGRVLAGAGASAQAIPILQRVIGQWEELAEKAGGQAWEKLLASPDHAKAANELGNLAAAMGDLANSLLSTGQHDEALAVAEKRLRINHRMGNDREVAAGHAQCANILMETGHYHKADARYDLALAVARQVGDSGLEGFVLQKQGRLERQRNQLERASRLCRQALERFREAGDQSSMLGAYNLLGIVDMDAGRLAEARAWYEKSRELAGQLNDQSGLGTAAQNIGISWQAEGEAARERGDGLAARRHFEEARRSVEESLRVGQSQKNKPDEAASWSLLAQIHLRLGNLVAAERHAHEARQIRETLGLKEAWIEYKNLSEIAQARGDLAGAAEWAKKRDDLRVELNRRARGGDGLHAQMPKALQALVLACARAGFGEGGLGPAEEEALAQLDALPAPFPAVVAFLRQLAARQLAPIPDGLPRELRELLADVVKAIREAF